MMNRILKMSLLLLMLCLTGCEMYTYHVNPASTSPYLNKPLRFVKPMILVQTRDVRPWGENYYYVVPAPQATSNWTGTYAGVFFNKIPSVHDFENAKKTWQAWQGIAIFNKSRVVGIVNSGTSYHVNKITTAPYSAYEVQITIDDGDYRGTKAFSAQPGLLVPVTILREEK